jgi:glyoxylase-like metal-dependent hydrolase (beta-lactamase superfamily II)
VVTKPLADGEELVLRDRRLETLHRPGHSPSDTGFWDSERTLLFGGDHLISNISSNPLISRPLDGSKRRTQSLVTYIESMKKTQAMPAEILLPGHGEPVTDHVALIDTRIASHERRKEKIYGLIAEQPRSGYEIAQAIWGNVAVTQAFLTLSEVIGHTDLLVNEGRVREVQDGEVIRYEMTTG